MVLMLVAVGIPKHDKAMQQMISQTILKGFRKLVDLHVILVAVGAQAWMHFDAREANLQSPVVWNVMRIHNEQAGRAFLSNLIDLRLNASRSDGR
jgi:hypothetical protein